MKYSYLQKITAVIICMAALLSFCACTKDAFVPSGMKKITNSSIVDYTMYVPNEWTEDISTGVVTAYYSQQDRSSISMMAFDHKDSSTTLAQYWEGYQDEYKATFSDMEILTDGDDMIVGNRAAKKYVYNASVTGTEYRFMQVFIISGGYVYCFTYTSTPEKYESHLEDVNRILEYIEFNQG
ncbi:MAG: hypothetical protein PUE85_04535 [Firmicutes bacterium]|nr:hypothetical protein [Bacillota bacterium]